MMNSIKHQIKSNDIKTKNGIRGIQRLLLLLVITLIHILRLIVKCSIQGFTSYHAAYSTREWCRDLIKNLNIYVDMAGNIPSQSVLFVSNHRSYIDIAVIGQYFPCTFLAKKELASWPILGWAATLARVIFVDRNDRESRKLSRKQLSTTLKQGISIIVFPEGTSYAGPGILNFRPGTFELAAENNIAVVPVSIEYEDSNDAWVGDETFVRHFIHTFSKKAINVAITFGPAITGNELLQPSYEWIKNTLLHRHAIMTKESIGGTL